MVNDMLWTCCPYHVSFSHNILPRNRELKSERLVPEKRMEDVTNHKMHDKNIVSNNHAKNLECVFFFQMQ